jgi:hypothetical protein
MAFGRELMGIKTYNADPADTWSGYFPQPSFGYTVELRKALNIQRYGQNVSSLDRGIEFDQRRCAFKLMVDKEQITEMDKIFSRRGSTNGKYAITTAGATGFYLAGPDRGATGSGSRGTATHIFSLVGNPRYSEMRTNAFGFFEVNLEILIHSAPYNDIRPAPKDFLGDFTFGNVTGIRNPKMSPTQEQAVTRTITMGGENYAVASATDEFTCNMTITTTTGKMAEIVNFIQNERGEGFTIKGGQNYFPWGGHKEGGVYTHRVKLLNSNFIMAHVNVDMWELPLRLWRVPETHTFAGGGL